MRVFDTAKSASNVGLQVLFVIFGGLGLAWLVLHAGVLVIAATLCGILLLGFLGRPDLGLLAVLLVRASTDATLWLVPGLTESAPGPAGAFLTPNLGVLSILMAGGGLVLLQRRLPFMSLPGGVLLTLLLATGLLGTLRSENPFLAFDQWIPAASALIVYPLAASLFSSPKQVRRVIDILAASFIVPAAFGFYQLIAGQGGVLRDIGVTRIHGTFVTANGFALYLVVILSVFISQALVQPGRRRYLALVIVALASILLIATFSRFAWVGAVIVLLTVGALRARILLLVIPLVVVIALGLVPVIGERFSDPFGGSFADRVGIWQETLLTWKSVTSEGQEPLLVILNRLGGLGPGAALSITFAVRGTHPHNDYVRILVDYGVVGLGFYLGLLAVLVVTAFRSWQRSTDRTMGSVALSFLTLALAYPIMSITAQIFGLMYNQVYFWTLAGLAVSAGRFASNKDRSSSVNSA